MYIPEYKRKLAEQFNKARREREGLEPDLPNFDVHGPILVQPEIKNRPVGREYTRYFVTYLPTKEFFEIDIKLYKELQNDLSASRLYVVSLVKWDTTLPKTTQLFRGYIERGSNHANFYTLMKLSKELPQLFDTVSKDNTFQTTAYTPGQEFKTRDGKEYKGSYEFLKNGEIQTLPNLDIDPQASNKRLYPIDKIFTEFDR